ncbi:MAG TPA: hypothetical protein PLJ45_10170 [Sphingorhabdus sp.]|jgi:hypothetical protein|uniref:hypothetical protein n=1 Tax=Sphingorhabdus sp. TaxID=1902408 RepID=UPI000BC756F0|nr:hypothetical protein [Sphingorhabdus sp.]OYY96882.1 MAG: hypothetical protein B7Y38_09305 [Sphingomonadales bacterium 28-56-43]OYZ59829.1 MAG: hypothetical protein B7Y10_09305 [Sphingomonadales bacterium 24-56-14]HQS13413.1 hypothetical protein [Sphingorhabdus sp.]HQS80641.1 hypothetical protein [Sphingorhabdus sp.]
MSISKLFALGFVASAALAGAAPAFAETLTVQGTVVPYCNVNLSNVSSGTASVAMARTQTVANLLLSCNSATGTKLVVTSQNGDLTNQVGPVTNRINYDMILDSPSDGAFGIAATDTYPGSGVEGQNKFTRSNAGYTQPIANGIPLVLSMNLNVAVDANNTPTSQNFPANAAPAGTYTEVFSFTASAV